MKLFTLSLYPPGLGLVFGGTEGFFLIGGNFGLDTFRTRVVVERLRGAEGVSSMVTSDGILLLNGCWCVTGIVADEYNSEESSSIVVVI